MKRPEALRRIGRWVASLLFAAMLSLVGAADLWAQPFAYITNYSSGTVSVIDVATTTVKTTVDVGRYPAYVAVHPYDSRVYIGGTSAISVIDSMTNAVVDSIPARGGLIRGMAVSPDGTRLYVGQYHSRRVVVFDTMTSGVVASVPIGAAPRQIAVSPDSTRVYVTMESANTVAVIDAGTNTLSATVPVGRMPVGLAVHPNGKVYVANYYSDNVSVIDTATNPPTVDTLTNHFAQPFSVAIDPAGTRVYVTNLSARTVSVLNLNTDGTLRSSDDIFVGSWPTGVDVDPTGVYVCVANYYSNNVSIINTITGTIGTIPVGLNPVAFGRFITR